ncbi:hypothetical protein CPB83DRAFT_900226 [Crepidotus variabilis]|uniref:Uncharacterized protein n=1 Tax=Crepidotus variabilis TaxID=179855 RepID=A0A9P6E3J4_9AGAR|nr:hypothetical protein CPB83DRAFT_900226 [Crepidotus variabilis]
MPTKPEKGKYSLFSDEMDTRIQAESLLAQPVGDADNFLVQYKLFSSILITTAETVFGTCKLCPKTTKNLTNGMIQLIVGKICATGSAINIAKCGPSTKASDLARRIYFTAMLDHEHNDPCNLKSKEIMLRAKKHDQWRIQHALKGSTKFLNASSFDFIPFPLIVNNLDDPHKLKAYRPKSFDNFKKKLQTLLKSGVKYKPEKYIRLDTDLLKDQMLQILDKNRDLLAFICPQMPEQIHQDLVCGLDSIYPGILVHTNTKSKGKFGKFPAVHHCIYNRYCKSGTCRRRDPAMLQKEGSQHHVNIAMSVPHASVEMKKQLEEYIQLQCVFKPLFDWITELLEKILPDSFEVLSKYIDILPCAEPVVVYPFSGFVINFNVATRLHCDWQDHDICLVLAIMDKD